MKSYQVMEPRRKIDFDKELVSLTLRNGLQYVADGDKTSNHMVAVFQLIDVANDVFRRALFNKVHGRIDFDEKDGWFTAEQMNLLRRTSDFLCGVKNQSSEDSQSRRCV